MTQPTSEKWNVCATDASGEKYYAWGLTKERAKEEARIQRSRRIYKSVRIERDKPAD